MHRRVLTEHHRPQIDAPGHRPRRPPGGGADAAVLDPHAAGWGLGEIPDIPRLRPLGAPGRPVHPAAAAGERGVRRRDQPLRRRHAPSRSIRSTWAWTTCEDFARRWAARPACPTTIAPSWRRCAARRPCAGSEVRALKARAIDRAFAHFLRDEWQTGSGRRKALERFIEQHRGLDRRLRPVPVLHERVPQEPGGTGPSRLRDAAAGGAGRPRARSSADEILSGSWLQWQLDEQWHRARAEARGAGAWR